ncbi:uncharacterized protein K452DRAFT_256269 [Aplosporella prunicola CBS 121167]|uniref:Uncharacterized protein n=1 Tax=Aplosporella prunicola CBS 121167 TaxID=1176127 RepID=A0A6A6B5V8_9PEZI|nr:uncharacterized protein K452DRAFT_256269 [Aplosporella prunicola CBS 121167]KAF2138634.1 hypothetical protein K452DRAFT_256269 [Aplosporella prunicola CBS 121167]
MMLLSFAFLAALAVAAEHNQDPLLLHPSCTLSHVPAFGTVDHAVDFSTSTSEHLDSPKLSAVNATAWEQWEFDSVSDSGRQGIIISFNRDAVHSFVGRGNLRVEFYGSYDDGSAFAELDHAADSYVFDCPDYVKGVWNSSDREYIFVVDKALQRASVSFNTPRATGHFDILSPRAPAHFPDGSHFPLPRGETAGSSELLPKYHMAHAIAAADTHANMTVAGRSLHYSHGIAGHMRLWVLDSWLRLVQDFRYVRAAAGPYALTFWLPTARQNPTGDYASALLTKDGKVLVSTRLTASAPGDQEADYATFVDEHAGLGLRGRLGNDAAGHVVEFVSPTLNKRWRFRLEHLHKKFEMGMGGHTGLSAFTNRVLGSEVGSDCVFEGSGFSEQGAFPEGVPMWMRWVLRGVGKLQDATGYVRGVVKRAF